MVEAVLAKSNQLGRSTHRLSGGLLGLARKDNWLAEWQDSADELGYGCSCDAARPDPRLSIHSRIKKQVILFRKETEGLFH